MEQPQADVRVPQGQALLHRDPRVVTPAREGDCTQAERVDFRLLDTGG